MNTALAAFLRNPWHTGFHHRLFPQLFHEFAFTFTDEAIGGYGSVHLYVAER